MGRVKISDVKYIVHEILKKSGVSDSDTDIIVESILYANRRGKPSHGLVRLPIYIRKIKAGLMSTKTELTMISEAPVISIVDANHGFGQVAGARAMELCINKAKTYGIGVVGIRNSNNFGTAGYLAEIAVEQEMIGIILSNSAPAIAPWGGNLPIVGTNPICTAFPSGNGKPPIVLDMATSVIARGKIRLAARNNEKIPFGWAMDSNGLPTDDPLMALKGSLMPIGGHKGFGLSLAVDIIAGLLTGSAFGGEVNPLNHPDSFSRNGHLLMAINIDFFLNREEYYSKIEILWENIKASGEQGSVYMPGERSFRELDKNDASINLREDQINEINALAKDLGIDFELSQAGL